MKIMSGQLVFFPGKISNLIFSYKNYVKFQKFCPGEFFVVLKCRQNFEVLQLVWTFVPNTFCAKCLKWLIFAQVIVFHPYFMEILLKIFIKSISLAILSNHYVFFKKKKKKMKCLFLVNLHHFMEHYEARKDEEPIWRGKWDKSL